MIKHWKNLSLENIDEEIWKEVEGCEGIYLASSFCRFKALSKIKINGKKCSYVAPDKVLKQWINNKGYLCIDFKVNKKQHHNLSHRVIAKLFIPNPDNKPCINHKNGVKMDNRLDNLEWCTKRENSIHAFKTGLLFLAPTMIKRGAENHMTRQVVQLDLNKNFINCFDKMDDAKLALKANHISEVCMGLRKKCKGFIWMYKTDYDKMIANM